MRRTPGRMPISVDFGSGALTIIRLGFQSASSQAIRSVARFHRGGFPGLADLSTFSSAWRLVSTLARA
jgi:hypothetical protein